MNRKDFLKKAGLASSAFALPFSEQLWASERISSIEKITILHTNDTHSHIEPFPENDPKYAGMGGVARRAALIQRIREQEKNVLLVDAGDIFQGTPYFNYFGGKLEFELMSKMGYEVATLGNHDFDNGTEGLFKQLPNASFSFVNANYTFTNNALVGKFEPYKIIQKGKLKIGIIGVGVDLNGLVNPTLCEGVSYQDPIDIVNQYAALLKQQKKCNLVICLSHLGYEYPFKKVSDLTLAAASENVDLIIGGHTHTFLEKPKIVKNRENQGVYVCQVGWAGICLGRIDILFDTNTNAYKTDSTMYNIFKKTIAV